MSRKVSTNEEENHTLQVAADQTLTAVETKIKESGWEQLQGEVDQPNNVQQNCQTPKKTSKQQCFMSTDRKTGGSPIVQNCGCSKSGCLKLYCSCFAKGQLCTQGCTCRGCKNASDNLERAEAINEIIQKDDMAFSRKYIEDEVSEGCNCRKSGCSKKYCECFKKGKRCIEKCTCFECNNMKEGHLKTEERVMHKQQTFRKTFDLLRKKIKLL